MQTITVITVLKFIMGMTIAFAMLFGGLAIMALLIVLLGGICSHISHAWKRSHPYKRW